MVTSEAVAMIAAAVSRAVTASPLSQTEVAVRAGMSRTKLSRKLRGGVALDVAELANVADALGVTPETFFAATAHSDDGRPV
jgi:transcriptional regulator with XRE-family HTH domain